MTPLLLTEPLNGAHAPMHLPRFRIGGDEVVLDALQMQSVPRAVPAPVIPSPAAGNSAVTIIAAIDEVIARGYG